jgi:hypothetical protein
LPNARFEILCEIVEGPYAFLLWRAEADGCEAVDGADSFVIRDGQIVMQSVFYRLKPRPHRPEQAGRPAAKGRDGTGLPAPGR